MSWLGHPKFKGRTNQGPFKTSLCWHNQVPWTCFKIIMAKTLCSMCVLTINTSKQVFHSPFTVLKTEISRSQRILLRTHSWKMAVLESAPRSVYLWDTLFLDFTPRRHALPLEGACYKIHLYLLLTKLLNLSKPQFPFLWNQDNGTYHTDHSENDTS